jgi:predicted membrane channel-forming protein YqfA (hemolysin III family)
MKQNPKKSIWQYLAGAGLILIPCLGVLMFTHEAGLDDATKLLTIILIVVSSIILLAIIHQILGYYLFVALMVGGTLYAIGMLGYAIAAFVLILVVAGIYRIGTRFDWWKEARPRD